LESVRAPPCAPPLTLWPASDDSAPVPPVAPAVASVPAAPEEAAANRGVLARFELQATTTVSASSVNPFRERRVTGRFCLAHAGAGS